MPDCSSPLPDLNVYDILKYETLVLSDQVVDDLHERFGRGVALDSFREPVPEAEADGGEAPAAAAAEAQK